MKEYCEICQMEVNKDECCLMEAESCSKDSINLPNELTSSAINGKLSIQDLLTGEVIEGE